MQEIDNPDLLTGPAREKIAKMSGRTIEDLNQLIFVYKQSLIVYLWLQEKYVRDVVSLLYSASRSTRLTQYLIDCIPLWEYCPILVID